MEPNLADIKASYKKGEEQFYTNDQTLGYTLKDFWMWSVSDLVSNATRGVLAEFIVAKALGISVNVARNEWGSFDLETSAKLKVEVKSAAYIQSWHQEKISTIRFSARKTRPFDAETNILSNESQRQADVYVFALLAHKDKPTVNPLNVSQWDFYVLPTSILNDLDHHSVTLTTFDGKKIKPVDYFHLAEEINKIQKDAGSNSAAEKL